MLGLPKKPHEIDHESVFWDTTKVPDTQLTQDLTLPFRVYVLESDDFRYVGFEHKSQLGPRVRDHFAGKGAHFTQHHRPKKVLGVWTVAHAAAEGYVFSLILSTLGPGCVHRIGGFTQTSVTPSPLCKQHYEEQRRLLRNLCFKCGGSHWARKCDKPVQGVEYKCPTCKGKLVISSRGQSVMTSDGDVQDGSITKLPSNATTSVSGAPQFGNTSNITPLLQPLKRPLASCTVAASPVPLKSPKTSSHSGKVVLVGGQRYSAVSWFHGRANPPPKVCRRIQDSCTAVELKGGDLRTLVRSGYASERPKELLQQGSKLCSQWRQTDITGLLVRSAGVELGVSLRQALFLEADLRKMKS